MKLSEIKAALPKYIYLTQGMHRWKKDDIFLGSMCEVLSEYYGTKIDAKTIRPIPDEVLENQAFWILYNKLATVTSESEELGVTFYISRNALGEEYLKITRPHADLNTRRFVSMLDAKDSMPLLGHGNNIIKHLSAGDLYSKWLMEQIEW